MGCSLARTSGGYLRYRFRWPLPGESKPYRHGETTVHLDTPENREKLEPARRLIGEQIRAGTFEYLAWFPHGRKAHLYLRARDGLDVAGRGETIAEYFDRWLPLQDARVEPATVSGYRTHFRAAETGLLALIGNRPVGDITRGDLEFCRASLARAGRSQKHAKNVIGGSLRALLTAARAEGLLDRDPYETFTWKKVEFEGADPYTAAERDAVLAALRVREFRSGRGSGRYRKKPHFPYYVAAYTIAWTGLRPEEVVALEVRDFDPKGLGFFVRRAKTRSGIGPTKSSKVGWSACTPENADLVKLLIPLRAQPTDPIFRGPEGRQMDQGKLSAAWTDECHTLKIRARGLYSLKDTFCTLYISSPGATWEWLSEQTRVSIRTLREHYARFERSRSADQEELKRLWGSSSPEEFGPHLDHGSKRGA